MKIYALNFHLKKSRFLFQMFASVTRDWMLKTEIKCISKILKPLSTKKCSTCKYDCVTRDVNYSYWSLLQRFQVMQYCYHKKHDH